MALVARLLALAVAVLAVALNEGAGSNSPDSSLGAGVWESLDSESECSSADVRDGSCSTSWLQRRSLKLGGGSGAALEQGRTGIAGLDGASSKSSTRGVQLHETSAASEQRANASREASSFCDTHTEGTCRFSRCNPSRGPTQCQNHRCRCLPGYCALYGSCHLSEAGDVSCPRSTGGTCKVFGCSHFRGPTRCVDGQCLCQEGYCSSDDGTCHRHNGEFKANVVEVNSNSPKFPGNQGKVKTALCFSGGGSRSLSLTLGALRALESLGLMAGVDAISSVSGGSWASAIYMFAKMDAQELLGKPASPSDLSLFELGRTPPPLGDVARTNVIKVAEHLFESTNYNELWIKTFARALLEPFGLGNDATYMAADAESVEAIVRANPQLRAEQFLVPQQGRPKTFVISGTLLAPDGHKPDSYNAVSLQFSPDWSGSPFYPENQRVSYMSTKSGSSRGRNKPLLNVVVGGGLVESFAFGGQAPRDQSGGEGIKMEAPPTPLSLATAVGISSAAFAAMMSKISLFSDTASKLIPKGEYWPVMSARFPGTQGAMRYEFGDGGNLENGGVLAMLQRGARRIAWFVNTDTGISPDVDFCSATAMGTDADMKGLVTDQLADKFGYRSSSSAAFLNNNQVFEEKEFFPLVCTLQRKRDAGKPAVVSRYLEVRQNGWWGIAGGFKVELLIVYNEKCSDFEAQLPADTQEELQRGKHGMFAHFPWFKTVMQNKARFTSYSSEQINLLSAQSEYAVRQNADLFRRIFS